MKKKIKITLGFFLVVVSIISLQIWNSWGTEEEDSKIIIGGITDLTGGGAPNGLAVRDAAQLRVDQINSMGGINGREVQVIWKDGKCDYDAGAEAARELIEEHGVKIIFGGRCSADTLGAASVANKAKVILITPTGSSPLISDAGDYVFRTNVISTRQAHAYASYLSRNKIDRVGVLEETSSYSKPITEAFNKIFPNYFFVYDFVNPTEGLLKNAFEEFRKNEVEVVFLNLQKSETVFQVVRLLESVEMPNLLLVNQAVLDNLLTLESTRPIFSDYEILGSSFYISDDDPRVKQIKEKFKEKYDKEMTFIANSATSIDAVDVIYHALLYVTDINDTDEIKEKIYSLQIPGHSGPIYFDKNGDVPKEKTLLNYDNGKFVLIK